MEIVNMDFRYQEGGKKILDNVNVGLKPDQLNVVLGLNGSGKTTLFNIMAGSLKPNAGELREWVKQSEIAYQVQGVPFLNALKGKDLVRLFLKTASKPFDVHNPVFFDGMNEREQSLAKHLWHLKLGDMSLGERRWLMVTAMCALDRKLYIFDEPTSGVDPDSRLNVLNRLESVARSSGQYVVMSTHTLQELEHVNCHIFLLHDGKIVFEGSYSDLTSVHQNPDEAFRELVSQ
ncbi:ATP-binding cassette domain-containing protein [Alkalibacillus almallahensis]|uniref:ATP-binding cassette domain-containing protein n=1 Tax=Alkalibacillus almallahensis TaxID=1379154 RepID=UPI00141E2843|nr:ABC-2 type transport system ATP-binding protein [Alkalibacillus almallahensis]